MAVEAQFHVNNHIKSQNAYHGDTENPYVIFQIPLHNQKVSAGCTVIARRIIGPIFFCDTVNSKWYVKQYFGVLV
jgi:hypothetical protein